MSKFSYGYDESFDSLWLYEPKVKVESSLQEWYEKNYNLGFPITTGRRFGKSQLMSLIEEIETKTPGGIPPEIKERNSVSYNDNSSYPRSNQEQIDDAVRERIEKPRREAEIAKRIDLVTALETLADAPTGTVVTFSKKNSRSSDAGEYAGLKFETDKWAVTGDGRYTNGAIYMYSELLAFLTTGPDLAFNVQVATDFSPVAAPATV